eukprot:CAMPEP_0115162300 /NCGR_PEP_ID=MMETSP0227-20121206/71880_1 /TAXON_ID=89957 /ORGANISM="Polarella glacialis, Strain CCMP 1383" /LENGTH=41 /DNA_ID= /DNA_START= /DNA_END= /DNA_ORIENTATION=
MATWGRRLKLGVGGGAGTLCLVAGVGYNRDEGFRRACQFNV